MGDLQSQRWAAVADTHLPSIAKSLKRIADALEAIDARQANGGLEPDEILIGKSIFKYMGKGHWTNTGRKVNE